MTVISKVNDPFLQTLRVVLKRCSNGWISRHGKPHFEHGQSNVRWSADVATAAIYDDAATISDVSNDANAGRVVEFSQIQQIFDQFLLKNDDVNKHFKIQQNHRAMMEQNSFHNSKTEVSFHSMSYNIIFQLLTEFHSQLF